MSVKVAFFQTVKGMCSKRKWILYLHIHNARCGEDLKVPFSSSMVHFINCIPMREANSTKTIYQVGALRLKASYLSHVLLQVTTTQAC